MAWPKPPLPPVIRMTRVLMRSGSTLHLHESRSNRLLVAAHDADVCRRAARPAKCIHGEDALPRRRGHQAFAEGFLGRQPFAFPAAPGIQFRGVEAREAQPAVAEQFSGGGEGQFGADAGGGVEPAPADEKEVGWGAALKRAPWFAGVPPPKIKGARAFAKNQPACEQSKRVRRQP